MHAFNFGAFQGKFVYFQNERAVHPKYLRRKNNKNKTKVEIELIHTCVKISCEDSSFERLAEKNHT